MKRLLYVLLTLAWATPVYAQTSTFTIPADSLMAPVVVFPASAVNGAGTTVVSLKLPNGSVSAPSLTWTSATTSGPYFDASGNIAWSAQGAIQWLQAVNAMTYASTGCIGWSSSTPDLAASDTSLCRGGAGRVNITNTAGAIGSSIKVDALPTVASGFGTSPAITAGSTPFAGSVNVGTGGAATSGVINFNGTAFPSAPFCIANDSTTTLVQRASATTTQLTITSAAWTASDVVTWVCVSSK